MAYEGTVMGSLDKDAGPYGDYIDDGTLTGSSSGDESAPEDGYTVAACTLLHISDNATALETELTKRKRSRYAKKSRGKVLNMEGSASIAAPAQQQQPGPRVPRARHRRGAVPGTNHSITHIPADPQCRVCIRAKMQAAAVNKFGRLKQTLSDALACEDYEDTGILELTQVREAI